MNPVIPIDTIAGEIARHLWTVSLQAGVLALLALLAERLFRNAPPGFRYWLWMLVVIRLAVPVDFAVPFGMRGQVRDGIATVMERLTHREIPAAPTVSARSTTDNPVPGAHPEAVPAFAPFPEPAQTALRRSSAIPVLTVWSGVSAFLLAAMLAQCVLFRWRLRNSRPVYRLDFLALISRLRHETGLHCRVKLMRDDTGLVHAPAVTGVFRPRIWLPGPIVDSWSSKDLEPVLLHELAHIKRHDLLLNGLLTLVQVLWFFHPLFWLANHRIRSIREEICDDMAVAMLPSGRERYALSMIRAGEEILRRRGFAFAGAGFSERKSSLGARVRRIMDDGYSPHRKMRAGTAATLLAVVALGAALACERTERQSGTGDMTPINTARKTLRFGKPGEPVILLVFSLIRPGSVEVLLDGKDLVPETDYTVDYSARTVTILNRAALRPGAAVDVLYERSPERRRNEKIQPPAREVMYQPVTWDPQSRSFQLRRGRTLPDSVIIKRANRIIPKDSAPVIPLGGDGKNGRIEAESVLVTLNGKAIKPGTDSAVSGPDNPEALLSRAADLMVTGKLEEADRAFQDFITRFPKSPHVPRAEYYRALCAYNLRRFPDAGRLFGAVVSDYPDSAFIPEALFYRADSNYNLGNFAETVRGFDELITRFPDSPKAEEGMFTKAWALLDMGRERESVETLRALVGKYPKGRFAASALFSIGDYRHKTGNLEAAREALEELLKRYPDSTVAPKARDMLRALEKAPAR